ncbi:apolipoprotein D-like [Panulirus ornatus]|uniref:apolipoprotein D-like n=1 Tax=Panulirus ornatus TaxID=150431 RepID=UPI003A85938B
MRTFGSIVVVLVGLVGLVAPHSMEFGSCRAIRSFTDFEPKKFEGLWHVIEITSTSSRCMTMNFTLTDSGFMVTEVRQFFLFNKFNLDHTFTNRGFFFMTDSSNPAKMVANWNSNFLGNADVTVVDTDYTQFAVLYECQSLTFLRRTSAVILSRTNNLDGATVERVKNDLQELDINVAKLDTIEHENCKQPGEADFDLSEDSLTNLFTTGKLGGSNSQSNKDSTTTNIQTDVEVVTADNKDNEILNARR